HRRLLDQNFSNKSLTPIGTGLNRIGLSLCQWEWNLMAPEAKKDRSMKNLVIIITDDQRTDTINADAMPYFYTAKADFVHYPNYFPSTPLCDPARTALWTGQYDVKNGITVNSTDDLQDWPYADNLFTALRAADYTVAYYGKWMQEFEGAESLTGVFNEHAVYT